LPVEDEEEDFSSLPVEDEEEDLSSSPYLN
jgi:hypothetical protein